MPVSHTHSASILHVTDLMNLSGYSGDVSWIPTLSGYSGDVSWIPTHVHVLTHTRVTEQDTYDFYGNDTLVSTLASLIAYYSCADISIYSAHKVDEQIEVVLRSPKNVLRSND